MEAIKEAVFNEYMPFIVYVLFRSLVLFTVGLGSVYIVGRMLAVVNSNRARNTVAVLTIAGGSVWTTIMYDAAVIVHPHEYFWRPIVYTAIGCLLYVILGFKLAGRLDSMLNERLSKESDETNDMGKQKLEKKENERKNLETVISDIQEFMKKMKDK